MNKTFGLTSFEEFKSATSESSAFRIRKKKKNQEMHLLRKLASKQDTLSDSDLKVLFQIYPQF